MQSDPRGIENLDALGEILYQSADKGKRKKKGEDAVMERMACPRTISPWKVQVEAMASHRPYRPALGIDAAMEEIEKNKGVLYDRDVAETCLRLFRDKGFQIESRGHGILEHSDGR